MPRGRSYLALQRTPASRPRTAASRLDSEPAVAAASFPAVEHQLRAGSPLAAPELAGLHALHQASGNQAVQRLISEPPSAVAVQRVRLGAPPPGLADRARSGATSLGARMLGAITGDRASAERTVADATGHNSEELLPLGVSDLVQNSADFGALAEERNAQNTMARTAQSMAQDHAMTSAAGRGIDAALGTTSGGTIASTALSAGRNFRQAATLHAAQGQNEDVNAALSLAARRQMVEGGLNVAAGAGSMALTATGAGVIASGATGALPTIGMAIHDRVRRDQINAASEGAAQHLSSTDATGASESSRAVGTLLRDQRAGAASEGASVLAGTQLFRRGITGGGNRLMSQAAFAQGLERQVAEEAATARATDDSAALSLHAPPMAMPTVQPRAPVTPARVPAVASTPASTPARPPATPAIDLNFAGITHGPSEAEVAHQQTLAMFDPFAHH